MVAFQLPVLGLFLDIMELHILGKLLRGLGLEIDLDDGRSLITAVAGLARVWSSDLQMQSVIVSPFGRVNPRVVLSQSNLRHRDPMKRLPVPSEKVGAK